MTLIPTLFGGRPISTSESDSVVTSQGAIPASILQLLFDALHVGLAVLDENGTVIGHNAAWSGLVASDLPNSAAFALASNVGDACRLLSPTAEFEPAAIATGLECILNRSIPEFRTEYTVKDRGRSLTFEIRGFACEQESHLCVLLTHEDITLRKQAELAAIDAAERLQIANQDLELLNGRLERLASIDELTGLLNRRAFERALITSWEEASLHDRPMALILFDVDCFKQYNDSCGHPAGDACLQTIARALARSVSGSSLTAARYGGEEFAVILPDCDIDESWEFAHALLRQVNDLALPHPASTVAAHVSVSAGCGAKISPTDTLRDLLHRADTALYVAKRSGRNCVCR